MCAHKRRPDVVYWLGDSLYLNVTNKCPNNCYFCFRRYKKGIRDFNLKLEKEPTSEEIIRELKNTMKRKNWHEVVFCGFGEPLARLDVVLEVTQWIKQHYRKPVRVDTNGQGYLLNRGRDVAQELKAAGVDGVSVSLNAHDKETYNQICRPTHEGAYESILKFIRRAKDVGLDLEATAVTVPEVDITKVRELAEKLGAKFSIRDYIPCFW